MPNACAASCASSRPKRAVVIGAGYIGVEAADALRRNGLRVTILERSAHALLRDDAALHGGRPQATRASRRGTAHRRHGDARSSRIAWPECRATWWCWPRAFKPNVEMAAEAGIEIGRTGAIRTDERMETNLRGVFAAGDCAEVTHLVTGRPT